MPAELALRRSRMAAFAAIAFALLIVALAPVRGAGDVFTRAGSFLLLGAVFALSVASALAASQLTGPRRAVVLGLAFGSACGTLSQLHSLVRYVILGQTPVFPSPGLVLLIFGTHPCLIAGYAAALGWSRRAWRESTQKLAATLDAVLLATAATIIGIQLTYVASWPTDSLGTGGRALVLFWRCLPFTEVVLLVLLLSARAHLLGVRASLGLSFATLAFAVANLNHGQLALVAQAAAVTSSDVLWAFGVVGFASVVLVLPRLPWPAEEGPAVVTLGSSRLRAAFLVAAVLISALSTLVIGFRGERSPELAVAVTVFGVLLAARGTQALVAQRREAERLESSVAAERALTTTLEHQVGQSARELAEAQRVLQRMWALGQHVTQELDPSRVVERFMEAVVDVAKVDGAALALRQENGTLRFTSLLGLGANLQGLSVPLDGSVMGRVVESGNAWCAVDLVAERLERGLHTVFDGSARGMAVVPLHRRGECVGTLTLVTRSPRVWRADELSRIAAMADLLSVALANAEAMAELRRAEWRFRTLFRAAPDMVLTVFPCGTVMEANDSVRDVLDAEPSEVIGRRLADFVVPEDRAALDGALASALSARGDLVEVRVATAAGGVRYVEIALRLIGETDPPTVLLIARDITRDREMRKRLVETERLAAVGELVAGVAHEVNNPLSSISAFAQLLLREETLDPEHREHVEVIHGETLRAAQVVKDLLAFARRSEPRREPVDLNQLVERTLRLRGFQLQASGARVELDLPAGLPPVLGDARQLQQVVLNLLVNSLQALEGVSDPVLRLVTRQEEEKVRLEIEDTGRGIPESARARVFEPFFTTKEEGEGTGLGLSVSYGIVAAHDGTLELVRTSERGTCFAVTLPAAPAIDADAAGELAVPLAMPSPLAGRRVLFVDDEPALRRGMEAFARTRGFDVVTAADARSALAALEQEPFDALVCDLRMPDVDGWALHEQVRARHPALAARTVFLTGDTVSFAARAGAASPVPPPALVAKPFRFEYLEEAVDVVLKGAGSECSV